MTVNVPKPEPYSYKVLITGGTAGIGLATAELLLEQGYRLFICGRNEDNLKEALKKLETISGSANVSGTTCDVRNFEAVCDMVKHSLEFLGGIDTLVNSAGVAVAAPIDRLSLQDWKNIIDTNLTGVFNCCKAAISELKKSKHANIINLGSRAGRYAFAGGTAYNTTKFGLQGFSEALFLDLNPYGIGVSLVAPGTVATGLSDIEEQEWHLRSEDIAKVIADILSNHKRANVNWVEIRPGLPR